MGLYDQVITEPCYGAPKGIIYGDPGVGKTTFAASADKHIILDIENGANHLRASKTPYLDNFVKCRQWIIGLRDDQHPYRVVGVDTIDWLTMRIIDHVVGDGTKDQSTGDVVQSIHRVHGGYGEGMARVRQCFTRSLLPAFDAMSARGIAVILLAHSSRRKIMSDEGYAVEKLAPDIDSAMLPIMTEWADFVGLARIGKDGKRYLQTKGNDQILAKSRYKIPPSVPLDWSSFAGAIKSARETANTNTEG